MCLARQAWRWIWTGVIKPNTSLLSSYEPVFLTIRNMKTITALCWASSLTQAYSASSDAYVYFRGSSSNAFKLLATAPSISPSEARLIFAQRLGLSTYHSLGGASDSTLELLNEYGGQQQPLFHDEHSQAQPNKLLAIVEGVESPKGNTQA